MKVADAIGAQLDWMVAKCEGETLSQSSLAFQLKEFGCLQRPHLGNWKPSTNWAQGGPIIEREKIAIRPDEASRDWLAEIPFTLQRDDEYWCGPTPLIAAMRCLIASKLGDEVEVPEELKEM